jgi:hypothetical protein
MIGIQLSMNVFGYDFIQAATAKCYAKRYAFSAWQYVDFVFDRGGMGDFSIVERNRLLLYRFAALTSSSG